MTERITITIPDQLHKRLQLVKDSLNVSGVCQVAIESAVTIEELKLKENPLMADIIERLKLEKQEDAKTWKEKGAIDGTSDVAELSYQEFRELASNQRLSDNLLEWVEDRHIQYLENPDEDAYLEGWLEAVLDFWDTVKEHLT